jgi:hypothetical protein
MKNPAIRCVGACLAALAITGAATMAGEGSAQEAAEAEASAQQSPRCTAYFANYHQDLTLLAGLAMLVDSCRKGYMTHVIASFGGGGVGDFRHLLDPAQPEWYPLLRDRLMLARGINPVGAIVGQTFGGRPFLLTPK